MSPITHILKNILSDANKIVECTSNPVIDGHGHSTNSTYSTMGRETTDNPEGICNDLGTTEMLENQPRSPSSELFPKFPSPQPLTSRLLALGAPRQTAEDMSAAYLRKAEELKESTEGIVRFAYLRVKSLPRAGGLLPIEALLRKLFEAHYQGYQTTLASWANETVDIFRAAIVSEKPDTHCNPQSAKHATSRCKRKFKSDYLPLFEFAFEKDRFPSREDKRQLAKISGMSYRQVSVWFQNRRCRHAARSKSHHLTSPPQTFEEMKERLSASAREALSSSQSAPKDTTHNHRLDLSETPTPAVQHVALPSCSTTDEDMASSQPSDAATLSGVSEISDGGFDSEERDELECDDAVAHPLQPGNITQLTSISSSYELTSSPTNPLHPFKTPTANIFPSIYQPSKPTSDPFVVEHEPWLRSSRALSTRPFFDPTPEALEDIIGGFDSMEVDVPMIFSGDLKGIHTESSEQSTMPPSRWTIPSSRSSAQRTFSSSSSGSCGSWSSGGSGPLSRSSSYSTALSSVLSSPRPSENSLTTPSECAVGFSDYAPSPLTVPNPSEDEESVYDTPNDEAATAGSLLSMKPASKKARVAAWMSDVSTQKEKDANANKWEQLLAAAVAQASPVQ